MSRDEEHRLDMIGAQLKPLSDVPATPLIIPAVPLIVAIGVNPYVGEGSPMPSPNCY